MSMPRDDASDYVPGRIRRRPSTPSAVFIGRVGGLAVALGIGAAIIVSPGIAAADTDGSESSSESSSSSGGSSAPKDKPSTSSEAADSAESAPRSTTDRSDTGSPDLESESESDPEPNSDPGPGPDPESDSSVRSATARSSAEPDPIDAAKLDDSLATSTDRPIASSTIPVDEPAVEDVSESPEPSALQRVRQVRAAAIEPAATASPAVAMTPSQVPATAAVTAIGPLGTQQQLDAERRAIETANTWPVALMQLVLRFAFASAAQRQFALVGGPDQANVDQLDAAVREYAMGAAFQQQILNSNDPTIVMQVAPPHSWYGQTVPGSRILYDNPDTIYRFTGVNAASTYVIRGQFTGDRPADTTFSVLTGLSGDTSAVLGGRDLVVDEDGTFVITASRDPAAPGQTNHLQLTTEATLIATRNTLSDWGSEVPMTLSIERIGGPPNSLFSQLGGFAIPGLGPLVVGSPLLTALVSLIPPLADPPPELRGVFAAVIMALGIQREATYMAVATTDPETGRPIPPNVLKNPTRNAEFLATQLQSAGYFQLADEQALVVTIDPGNAGYFVLPVTNDWTITKDYWNVQTSLNHSQAIPNPDGTYTIVVSPRDPGVANWVSTGGLNQGTISMRFQDLDPSTPGLPTVSARVVTLDALGDELPAATVYYTAAQRAAQLATRKAGFDNRFAPYPQP